MDDTDKKLLEAAAKAAGIEGVYATYFGETGINTGRIEGGLWNPLEDDAHALRLAVKLQLQITVEPEEVWAGHYSEEMPGSLPTDGDPYAATRRAVVRAAAAIGERM